MRKRKKKLLKGTGKKSKHPRNSKRFNDEDAPTKMSIKRPYRKSNGWDDGPYAYVNHSMVRRILKKHIGRPWDLVWKEICADNDSRNFEGNEVREWMEFAVEKNCSIDSDGTVRDERGSKVGNWRDGYYVHPESGLLCHVPHGPRWKRKEPVQKVFEMDGILYHENEGNWYRVKMREVTKTKRTRYTRDRKGRTVASYTYTEYSEPMYEAFHISKWSKWAPARSDLSSLLTKEYGLSPDKKCWYCYSKESANSKEISRIKKKFKLDDESKAA